ncbi:MAG: D-tagatose-bisphosphate aldolase, class II, non-catalytic subunit [Geminicoccaceae bacterium]
MNDVHPLAALAPERAAGHAHGITSVCSAHPLVIEAALLQAEADGTPALIEATCNQVNQEGGYTGMTPADFRDAVFAIADRVEFARDRIILGGDHLGPNPWKDLEAEEALQRAEVMVEAFVAAGYVKIHLDTSMGCAGEPLALADGDTAARAARLARVAEDTASRAGLPAPFYIIGTEVPTPGGALEAIDHMVVTSPTAAARTYDVHREAFAVLGLEAALERVIALVVQPGVEFGHENVVVYEPLRARALSAALGGLPGLVFEAHSTDYQPPASLQALVQHGFAILKVGPGLTFALREALYALDQIALALDPTWARHSLPAAMERVMLADPRYWQSHYPGTSVEQRLLRHYSYSDRIRYYWPAPDAQTAVERLLTDLTARPIPETLISQFLPTLYPRVMEGTVQPVPRELMIEAVRDVLRNYAAACRG